MIMEALVAVCRVSTMVVVVAVMAVAVFLASRPTVTFLLLLLLLHTLLLSFNSSRLSSCSNHILSVRMIGIFRMVLRPYHHHNRTEWTTLPLLAVGGAVAEEEEAAGVAVVVAVLVMVEAAAVLVMVEAVAVLVMVVEGVEDEAAEVVEVMVEVAISRTSSAIDRIEWKKMVRYLRLELLLTVV
jgi:hypothetical protein